MNWEEKLAALKALVGDFDVYLMMRCPGDWYVHTGIDIGGDGFLVSGTESGINPQAAVELCWDQLTENLPSDRYLVVKTGERYRWQGYMWRQLPK